MPEARTTFYSNDPRLDPARYGWWIGTDVLYRNNASLSDSWRPTRHLTITPALSYIWSQGQNSAGDTVVDNKTWAPSVAAAWDATHDGRTVIRGSYSQYVDVAIRTPVLHTSGSQTTQRCLWDTATNAYTRDCVYSGGASREHLRIALRPGRRGRHRRTAAVSRSRSPAPSSTPSAASARSSRASPWASTWSTGSSRTSTSSGRPTGSGTAPEPRSSVTATAGTRPSSTWERRTGPSGPTAASPWPSTSARGRSGPTCRTPSAICDGNGVQRRQQPLR